MIDQAFQLLIIAIFTIFVVGERIINTFSNRPRYIVHSTPKEMALVMGMTCLYAATFFISLAALFGIGSTFNGGWVLSLTGIFIWLIGVWVRRTSIRSMGKNWSIFRSSNHLKRFLALGPYEHSRHPYYAASMLELWGYVLLFQSINGAVIATFIYLPLIAWRACQEERRLLHQFGAKYSEYQKQTSFIFNPIQFARTRKPINNLYQLSSLIRSHGIKRLFQIIGLNQAVKRYFRNYMICQCMIALSNIGALDEMTAEGSLDITEYASDKDIDFPTLKIICDYLYVMNVLNKKSMQYSLTNYGYDLSTTSRGVFNFIYAYSPIFENLTAILKCEKQYGRDFDRLGEHVGRASAELAELFPFPISRSILKKYGFKTILDLGSGSGDFLIGFCRDESIRGYGVDLSPDAVVYAARKAAEQHVESRVRFVVGDITKPDSFNKVDPKIDLITSMFVLHEFLSNGEERVIQVLKSIRQAYPNRHVLICELTKCSLEELKANPSGVAEHHLFHALSKQGLAGVEQWHNIFNKSGYDLIEEVRLNLAEQSIFLIKPHA